MIPDSKYPLPAVEFGGFASIERQVEFYNRGEMVLRVWAPEFDFIEIVRSPLGMWLNGIPEGVSESTVWKILRRTYRHPWLDESEALERAGMLKGGVKKDAFDPGRVLILPDEVEGNGVQS